MDVSSRLEKEDGAWVKHVALQYGNRFASRPREVYYKSSAGPFTERADDLLALGLLPAMVLGERLLVRGAVSERLLSNLPQLQEILVNFGPKFGHDLSHVEVEATETVSQSRAGNGTASFFSGGLDSFCTVLRHQNEIDSLIFVHGFDIDVRNTELREKISRRIQGAASELGRPLIEIETNVRAFANRFLHWGLYYGSAIACLALALQTEFRKVYVAGGFAVDWLEPWGSHPMLDPLWSTEGLEIVHDAIELNRLQKTAFVSNFEVAQRYLRVCYTNAYGEYNCGHCRKCVLMQLGLAVLGSLDKFPVFETPLTTEAIENLDLSEGDYRQRLVTYIDVIKERDGDSPLIQAMQQALFRWVSRYNTPIEKPDLGGNLLGRLFPPVVVTRGDEQS